MQFEFLKVFFFCVVTIVTQQLHIMFLFFQLLSSFARLSAQFGQNLLVSYRATDLQCDEKFLNNSNTTVKSTKIIMTESNIRITNPPSHWKNCNQLVYLKPKNFADIFQMACLKKSLEDAGLSTVGDENVLRRRWYYHQKVLRCPGKYSTSYASYSFSSYKQSAANLRDSNKFKANASRGKKKRLRDANCDPDEIWRHKKKCRMN
jgi:hypothetical protein